MAFWDFPTKPAPHAGTCRMFEADIVERFSRIHPATPFVFWLPVVGVVLARAALRQSSVHDLAGGFAAMAALVVAGIFAWTLAEYVLHRWVFHWYEDTPRGRRVHFLLHGVHHDFPNDKDRLVMPLGFSIPLGIAFYLFYTFAFGVAVGAPFYAGFVLGYLAYDGSHYAIHHFSSQNRFFRMVKKHHMAHHHADHDGGFGVSSPLWDHVFRTMPEPKKRMGASTDIHFTRT